jgi:arylsulfatase A-like enzyme
MLKPNFLKLVLGILVITLAIPTSSAFVEDASAQATKNVVIIMTDDQNVDSLPVMRKLMSFPEGSWVNFTSAIVNDSVCCPARASVLTGQYAFITGVINNSSGDQLKDANTLPVWLDRAGYRTGIIGKYLNGFPWDKGADYVPPGWDHFNAPAFGNANQLTNLAVDFINSSTGSFFLYLAYWDPHWPATPLPLYANAEVYIPPDPPNFNETDVSDKPTWVRNLSPLSQATIDEWHNERIASQRSLLGVDDGIQRIVDTLKAKGELDNTIIIFMGDHGFSWGSHRHITKECVYEECIRFPLLIRYPGLIGNREETRIVSNVDLALTIAEYAGIIPDLPQNGKSLIPVIMNTAASWTNDVFIEVHTNPGRTFDGIRVPGWTYAEYINGNKELYDLSADPYQLQNRANQPSYQAIQSELAQRMRALKILPPGNTATPSATATGTIALSATLTNTPSSTDIPTPTVSPTLIGTGSPTPTSTATAVQPQTSTPTSTFTPTRTSTPTVTRTLTATATASPTTADLIFANGFESGNLFAWSSSATDLGDLSANSSAALIGNYGLQAVIDDNVSIYVTDDSPNTETRYRARFYFDPNSIAMPNGDTHYLFYGHQGASTVVMRVQLRRSSNAYQLRAALRNDSSTWTSSSWFTITDASHAIEIDWRASTAGGANNGGLTLWIDGTQRANLIGIDNDTRRIDRVQLGAVAGVDTGTRGSYYFDAFESRRQTYIGP